MEQVASAVGATLGPRGQTVVLSRPDPAPPLVTKDGVTVAKNITLADPWEQQGAKLIQEVAQRTNAEAGDGTTAATVLTHAMFREGVKQVTAGADPQAVERGIRIASACVVETLRQLAVPIRDTDLDEITSIATISANGDTEMGSVIAQAIAAAGLEGNFSLDTSPTLETSFTVSEGLEFRRGFVAPHFVADRARLQTVFEQCRVLVTDRRLIDPKPLAIFLQRYAAAAAGVPLLIIAEDIEQGALQLLAANQGNNGLFTCPVRTPGSGPSKKDEIEDIAILTGAKFFSVSRGDDPSAAILEDLGGAGRVVITPHRTTIVGGWGSPLKIEARKDELRSRIADAETPEFEKALCERRLAALGAKVAVIRIGSSVQSKLLEKRDRAEDSLNATLAALREGIVPGGGTALIRCLPNLAAQIEQMTGDERTGARIVAQSLTAPLHRIASNAGQKADVVVGGALGWNDVAGSEHTGYNASADRFENLIAAGVIDPVKVVRLAFQNAAELAGLLLTAAALVVEISDSSAPAGAPNPAFRG
jgi:chaperonin GroEL